MKSAIRLVTIALMMSVTSAPARAAAGAECHAIAPTVATCQKTLTLTTNRLESDVRLEAAHSAPYQAGRVRFEVSTETGSHVWTCEATPSTVYCERYTRGYFRAGQVATIQLGPVAIVGNWHALAWSAS